jgi:hypothetical protein
MDRKLKTFFLRVWNTFRFYVPGIILFLWPWAMANLAYMVFPTAILGTIVSGLWSLCLLAYNMTFWMTMVEIIMQYSGLKWSVWEATTY